MSSDLFPTVKSVKRVMISLTAEHMQLLITQSQTEKRTFAQLISKITGDYCDEKQKFKVV